MLKIGYILILGKPLVFYLGILTYFSLIFTAIIGYTNFKGKRFLPLIWHARMALLSLILATIHGLLAIFAYL